jgi:hypothetical protein
VKEVAILRSVQEKGQHNKISSALNNINNTNFVKIRPEIDVCPPSLHSRANKSGAITVAARAGRLARA